MFFRNRYKDVKPLNIALVSDNINWLVEDDFNIFDFEKYFLINFASSLRDLGNNVVVVLPWHRSIDENFVSQNMVFQKSEKIVISEREGKDEREIEICFYEFLGLVFIFVRDPFIFDRDGFIYDPNNGLFYPDNLHRFAIFSRSALESLKVIPFRPDVVHVIGKWASIASIYLRTLYKYDNFFRKSGVIFTPPSLDGQPVFVPEQYSLLGIDWKYYSYDYLEFYNKVNIIKGAIIFSNLVTFTSVTYIDELKREEFGNGLEGLIIQMLSEGKIKSVLPGVSTSFLPDTDQHLSSIGLNYSRDGLNKKLKLKSLVCKKLNFDESRILFMFFGEFTERTGISLVYEVFSDLVNKNNISLIIIGRGDGFREIAINEMAMSNPGKVCWIKNFDVRKISEYIGASDVVVVPSTVEPGTILHMVSMLYGSLPLVRGVGILNDIVRDKINGFKFYEYTPSDFRDKVLEVIDMYYKNPKRWKKIMETAMKSDFSWVRTARTYVDEIYKTSFRK
ncbi:MAG: glycogen/starch synthase [Brevinematales bacterium]|nr:glycogen/starch synthase [Brevinematales bacterium]